MLKDHAMSNDVITSQLEQLFTGAPKLDPLIDGARDLEEWYSATFQRRVSELAILLSTEIRGELRSEFDSELKTHTEKLRSGWETTTESLKKEIEHLKNRSHSVSLNEGLAEIARVEKHLGEIEKELERSFTMDSVPLSQLLKLRTTQTDLKSYLRGLKYFVGRATSESSVVGASDPRS